MKKILLIGATFLLISAVFGQDAIPLNSGARLKTIDSLEKKLAASKPDSNRVKIFLALSNAYDFNSDESIKYAREGTALAQKVNHKRLESGCLRRLGIVLTGLGHQAEALIHLFKALGISESINNKLEIGLNTKQIGILYNDQKDYTKARYYLFRSKDLLEEVHNDRNLSVTLVALGEMYYSTDRLDSASLVYERSYKLGLKVNNGLTIIGSLIGLGNVYAKKGDHSVAMKYFRQTTDRTGVHPYLSTEAYLAMAEIFLKTGQTDSSLFYAKQCFDVSRKHGFFRQLLAASKFLSEIYDGKNDREAYKYLKVVTRITDSLYPVEKAQVIQNLGFQEQQRLQSIEAARLEAKNRTRLYIILGILLTFLTLAIILFRNNRHKQKANELLVRQKQEIDEQRSKAEQTLKELKTTQALLIQSEKMASLGELTAGIAHEIQNPLNFVNNFSDVNTELIEEMKNELNAGNKEDALSIADSIKENEQKINHHGKRADAIVKGMLQHSRASSGHKEPTDINALADEYLRLSYHGLRAKDKSFNATIQTDFDQSLEKINIIPQDIGRMLLNLFNNAFYAVTEKKKLQPEGYEPTVSVSTKKHNSPSGNGGTEVIVKDNGMGIPQKVLDKIYQPFFSTKPPGQGTGLGLSLAYDIIKAHGGEIKVETKEARLNDPVGQGEGTTFIISIPVLT